MGEQDTLRSVLAQLTVLSGNSPSLPNEDDVHRFHVLVEQLAGLGYQVDDFRFDMERDLHRRWTSHNSITGETSYAPKREVRPDIFKNKVDALLLYFRLDQQRAPIGFDAPQNR